MLEAALLGQFSLRLDGAPVELASRPAQTLLAYLLLNPGLPHRREQLAGLLWPDSLGSSARKNLRNAVWQVRRAIGESYLQADQEAVAFNAEAPYQLDLAALEQESPAADPEALIRAVSVYKGDLLPGFYDDWVQRERVRLLALFERRMRALLEQLTAAGRWPEVQTWAEHWIAQGQAPEPAYRALMQAHAAQGDLAGMATVYRRCVQALKEELEVQPSAETQAMHERLSRGGEVERPRSRIAVAPLDLSLLDETQAAPGPCPFKGLRFFDEEDADYFFGREALTAQLVEYLTPRPLARERSEGERFLAVVGPSGSGKSSLVRAGLIPALKHGALPGSQTWRFHTITPTARPLESLAASLTRESESVSAMVTLMDDLARDTRSLHLAVRQRLSGESAEVRLALVVDQFEELFTLCHDEDARKQFIANLLYAVTVTGGGTIVVLTLRADFYPHCALHPELRQQITQPQVLVGPMDESELRRAIEAPAERAGWEYEAGLVETILADVAGEPGALPLLQHALLETWERRRGRRLTLEGYRASGGVQGAIAQRAETIYAGLPPEAQAVVRRIMLRLTQPGQGTEDTRRRAWRSELIPHPEDEAAVDSVLNALADARLITTDEASVDVAHEALIRGWPRLRQWLDEDREGLRIQHQLAEEAREWAALNRDEGALYRGARLAQAVEWAESRADELSAQEREFVAASRELKEREEVEREAQRAEREALRQRELEAAQKLVEAEKRRAGERAQTTARLRRGTVYLTGALLVALLAMGIATFLGLEARNQARNALSRELALQSTSQLEKNERSLALLLGLEAVREENTAEARGVLLTSLQGNPRLMTSLYGHASHLLEVAFSPDGALLATGGCSPLVERDIGCRGEILLWDVRDPRAPILLSALLTGHPYPVVSLAFSPLDGGATLVSGNGTGFILLWDVRAPRAPAQFGPSLIAHRGAGVSSVAISPDGSTLASGSFDTTIRLWDVRDPRAPAPLGTPLTGHTGTVWGVAFSPRDGGATLASASCKVIQEEDHECVGGEILLWDVRDPRAPVPIGPPLSGQTIGVWSMALSPSGATLASGSDNGTILLWDVGDPRAPAQLGLPLTGHTGPVYSVAFSPDGATLASAGCGKRAEEGFCIEGEIRLWDVRDPRAPVPIGPPLTGHTAHVWSITFSPLDGGAPLVSASDNGTILLWDVSGPRDPVQLGLPLTGHTDWVYSVALSPDGMTLASGSFDTTIRLWDVRDPHAPVQLGLPLVGHTNSVESVTFSPDGNTLASGSADDTIILWDVRDPHAPVQLGLPLAGHTNSVASVAFSPDGTTLASGSDDSTITLWDVRDPRAPKLLGTPLTGHPGGVTSVAFSSLDGGATLASSGFDFTIRLWDVRDPRAPKLLGAPLTGHNNRVQSVAFSPDGNTLASGSYDDTIRLWDVRAPRAPVPFGLPLIGHTSWVFSVAFSPDGMTLASSSEDATIRLWDVRDPRAPAPLGLPLTGHTDWVSSVAFSRDGATLASGSYDDTIILWDVRLESWQARACGQAGRNLTQAEWQQYFGGDPYRKTCEQWPEGE
jgi:WD40 repeat protein/DNA-binding SARP family transcriptional activator